jgi:predicted RNase H-like nuclease (RuvC/YqgF family)
MNLRILVIAFLLAVFTARAAAQESSAERQARSEEKIVTLERQMIENARNIEKLSRDMSEMRSAQDQFIGFGKGLGLLLAIMQGAQTVGNFLGRRKQQS